MRIELSLPQDFLDLLSSVGGIFYGDIKSRSVTHICTNSEECSEGDIFFALEGNRFDGNDFIPQAISRGAIPVGKSVGRYGIRVDSGSSALLSFASYYKQMLPRLKHTSAITGSVGKSTTKEFLNILSSVRYKTHATRENFNNDIGVSFTILSADKDTESLILELGMNHKGEISALSKAVKPDSAVITKLGSAHIGMLGCREAIAEAKLEITSALRGALYIPKGEKLLYTRHRPLKCFSSQTTDADVAVIKNDFDQLELYFDGELYSIFKFPLMADHILQCLAAAITQALEIGLEPPEICEGIARITEKTFRHRIIESASGYRIIDDSYNASYESVKAAFDMISEINEGNRVHAMLGDILELGDMSRDIHCNIGKLVASRDIHFLFLAGNNANDIADGAISSGFDPERIFLFSDQDFPLAASFIIRDLLLPGDLILVKASHGMNFKKIIDLIR